MFIKYWNIEIMTVFNKYKYRKYCKHKSSQRNKSIERNEIIRLFKRKNSKSMRVLKYHKFSTYKSIQFRVLKI